MTFCSCAALIQAKARRIAVNIAKLPEFLRRHQTDPRPRRIGVDTPSHSITKNDHASDQTAWADASA